MRRGDYVILTARGEVRILPGQVGDQDGQAYLQTGDTIIGLVLRGGEGPVVLTVPGQLEKKPRGHLIPARLEDLRMAHGYRGDDERE